MSPRRMLVYKFLALPHVYQLQVTEKLGITQSPEDPKFPPWIWFFSAVTGQMKVGQLWDAVNELAEEKFPIPNPFKTESPKNLGYEPITLQELKELGRRIDSEYVVAVDLPDLYRQLNQNYGPEKWTLLRAPGWCGDKLVALVVKPRNDEEDDHAC